MEFRDLFYEYQEVKKKTPGVVYGAYAEEYFNLHKDNIIEFRPPKKGERSVSWLDGNVIVVEEDFAIGNPRYIIRPVPKIIGRYVVDVYDCPPKAGERSISKNWIGSVSVPLIMVYPGIYGYKPDEMAKVEVRYEPVGETE